MALVYYVIDTETTGLDPKKNEVIEISIIRYEDRHQLSKTIKALYPNKASFDALRVIGKTLQDLQLGEPRETVVKSVIDFLQQDGLTSEHRCMVAHNAAFDKNFCHALFSSVDCTFPAINWLDTKTLARDWAKKLGIIKPKLTLQASLAFTGITPLPGIHNAKSDARNAYLLLKKAFDENMDIIPHIKRYEHGMATSKEVDDYLNDLDS